MTVQSNVTYDLTVADTGGLATSGGTYLPEPLEVSDTVPNGPPRPPLPPPQSTPARALPLPVAASSGQRRSNLR